MPNLFILLRGNRRCLFMTVLVCLDQDSLLVTLTPIDTKELEALNLLHYSPVDENVVFGPPFPVVHNHLLSLDHFEGKIVVLASHSQVSGLIPIGCLVLVGDQAYHGCRPANLMMVLESCLAMQS